MSEEYEKTTRNKQGENGNSMTGITGEITGNNWILKFLQVWKRVQKIPWLISVIEIWGSMMGIIGKMMGKSTWNLGRKHPIITTESMANVLTTLAALNTEI